MKDPCLELARDARANGGIVDLNPLKAYVANLPDFVPVDADWYEVLDTASAICFHLRMAFSFEFSARKYPAAEKAAPTTSGLELLKELGL